MNEMQEFQDYVTDKLKSITHKDCASVKIFMNCEGMRIEQNIRNHKDLKESGYTMRNIRGEWIK